MTFEDPAGMSDDFEVFSLLGRGKSVSPLPPQFTASDYSKPSSPRTNQLIVENSNCPKRTRSVKHKPLKNENSSEDGFRPRVNSMPSTEQGCETTRVRNFQTRGSSIKNRGDYMLQSRSNTSLYSCDSVSSDQEIDVQTTHLPLSKKASGSSASSVELAPSYRVLLLGSEGVGKTALTQQFLTSDDVTEEEIEDDGAEKSVPVELDGSQSVLIFMDQDYNKNVYDPSTADAYIVVYSITDEESFKDAERNIQNLRHFEKDKAIILVGNKSDLARTRKVALSEGKRLATEFDTKFVETSTILNHEVDTLLVGILSQIKLQLKRNALNEQKKLNNNTLSPNNTSPKRTKSLRKSVRGFVDKITSGKSTKTSKNCKNLLV